MELLYLYIISFPAYSENPLHKKRFVLMTDLKDLYHMVLVNKAEK